MSKNFFATFSGIKIKRTNMKLRIIIDKKLGENILY